MERIQDLLHELGKLKNSSNHMFKTGLGYWVGRIMTVEETISCHMMIHKDHHLHGVL